MLKKSKQNLAAPTFYRILYSLANHITAMIANSIKIFTPSSKATKLKLKHRRKLSNKSIYFENLAAFKYGLKTLFKISTTAVAV